MTLDSNDVLWPRTVLYTIMPYRWIRALSTALLSISVGSNLVLKLSFLLYSLLCVSCFCNVLADVLATLTTWCISIPRPGGLFLQHAQCKSTVNLWSRLGVTYRSPPPLTHSSTLIQFIPLPPPGSSNSGSIITLWLSSTATVLHNEVYCIQGETMFLRGSGLPGSLSPPPPHTPDPELHRWPSLPTVHSVD